MRRILIYSTAYFPLVGGAEVAIRELTDRLPEDDFELITARLRPNLPRREQIGRVLVHRFGLGFFGDKALLALFGGFYGWSLHQKKPFDLVWGVMASFGGFGALAFKKREPSVPFLLTLQEGDELKEIEHKARFLRGHFVDIFRRADHIQAISNYLADWARKLGASCPIEVVPNGVDLRKFKIKNEKLKIGDVYTNMDTNAREKIIVSASRLVKKNGLADLVLALKFLPSHVKLWLLGEGEEQKYLKQLIEESGLNSRVKMLGFMLPEKLPEFYAQVDIFARPSHSEGLGNAFLEAMACGLPVVGTRVGGIADFLVDKETGFVCEVANPENVASKISYILDPQNESEVNDILARAKKMIIEKYDWDILAPKFENIFTKLCLKNQ